MKHLSSVFAVGAIATLVAACASPELPTAGDPSPWDGQWSGTLPSDKGGSCDGLSTSFEVRYGHLLGTVSKNGVKKGDLWGEIAPDGTLKGHIGRAGVAGGYTDSKFAGDNLSGTWIASGCSGTVNVSKKS